MDQTPTQGSTRAVTSGGVYEQITQLGQKVDDISTGKYYGYYATAADLPETGVDGFAYVGSGPTYTIYNRRNGTWTSSGVTVNQSPIGNEEDIDQNASGKLQFANRVYNAQQPNGMGYVILRKNKTFAEQVTEENTIYEIRYDFDLGGTSVTIPAGGVLKFNGGSINNGIISADYLDIQSTGLKIFSDVTFQGKCRFTTLARVEWFISNYPRTFLDVSVDNSDEFDEAVNCGMRSLVVPNKFIRVTRTITISHPVNLLDDAEKSAYNPPASIVSNTNNFMSERPAIFSDVVTTLVKYLVAPFDGQGPEGNLTIGRISFVSTKPYTDLSERDTPILDIETNGLSLWGVTLHCDVQVDRWKITVGAETKFFKNRTGIQLKTTNGYITFVLIDGNIYGTFCATRCVKAGGGFLTSVEFRPNTRSCYGLDAPGIYPIIVGGQHQTEEIPATLNDPDSAYIVGEDVQLYGGVIWDVSVDGSDTRVRHKIKSSGLRSNKFFVPYGTSGDIRRLTENYNFIEADYNDYLKEARFNDNLFNLLLFGVGATRAQIKDFSYTLDGTSVFEHNNVFNTHHLFNENVLAAYSKNILRKNFNACAIDLPNTEHTLNFSATISSSALYDSAYNRGNGAMLRFIVFDSSYTLVISRYTTEWETYSTTTGTSSYTNPIRFVNLGELKASTFKIELTLTWTGTNLMFPSLFMPYYGRIPDEFVCPSNARPRFYDEVENIGVRCFDTTLGKPVWFNGTNWVDATGATV